MPKLPVLYEEKIPSDNDDYWYINFWEKSPWNFVFCFPHPKV